jgi:uncharacterized membrane protein YhhN
MKPQDLLPRLTLAAAILGAIAYVFTWDGAAPQNVATAVKGTGVGFLALYCAMLARDLDGWLIALVMLLGMLGDVLLNAVGLTTGALAFLAGHVVAIVLYRRQARGPLTPATIAGVAAFTAAVAAFAAWLPGDPAQAPGIGLYSAGLALMAACAWISRFPRALTGLGALLFLVSDLVIFAQIGPLQGQSWTGYAIWGLYFTGQLLIALGVTRTLAGRST